MLNLNKCKNIFLDFDGVIVDSNKFKELAIEKSIFSLRGNNLNSKEAINYFNKNAGISREKKLMIFFSDNQVSEILKIYGQKCESFFFNAKPTYGLKNFIKHIKNNFKSINLFVLSGGEKMRSNYFSKSIIYLIFLMKYLHLPKNKVDHLNEKKVSENDIFVGDSTNDLKASLKSGLRFVLLEEYKSLKSYPSKEYIKKYVFLKTKNFKSLLDQIIL